MTQKNERWNAGFTLLWTFIIVVVWQGLVATWVLSRAKNLGIVLDGDNFLTHPELVNDVFTAAIVGGTLCVLMVFAVIGLKKNSSIQAYLPMQRTSILEFFKWLGLAALVVIVFGWVAQFFGLPQSAEMEGMLRNTPSPFLMYMALVVAAPISEELLFRGFVISGLERLKIADAESIAVGVSSFLWAILHAQYYAHEMFQLFLLGVVLGFARIKTKSLLTPILIHALNNLITVFVLTAS